MVIQMIHAVNVLLFVASIAAFGAATAIDFTQQAWNKIVAFGALCFVVASLM